MIGIVYGIYDEDKPDEVRYIGKTVGGAKKRFDEHGYTPLTRETREWNKRVGERRNFLILDRVVVGRLNKTEQRWIRKALIDGHRLLNVKGILDNIVLREFVPWNLHAMAVRQNIAQLDDPPKFRYRTTSSWQHLEMRGEFFADKNAIALTGNVGAQILEEIELLREEDDAVRAYLAQEKEK